LWGWITWNYLITPSAFRISAIGSNPQVLIALLSLATYDEISGQHLKSNLLASYTPARLCETWEVERDESVFESIKSMNIDNLKAKHQELIVSSNSE